MEEEKKESEQSLLLVSGNKPQDIIEMAKNAEQWVAAMVKIKAAVLKLTHSGDWVDQAGKPYLQSSGAEKLAGPFGVKSKFIYEGGQPKVSAWKESESGGHYAYRIPMTVTIGNCSIDVVGKRSSSDQFFTTRYGYENGHRVESQLAAEEVDENNIIGSAISNGLANGISRILGLRNMTWEELNAANIYPTKKVAYDGKKEPSTKKPEQEREPEPNQVTGFVQAVTSKEGKKKDGTAYVKFSVQIESQWYGSFDTEIGQAAYKLKGQQATVTWKQDGEYKTIVKIEEVKFENEAGGAMPPKEQP